MHLHVVKSGGVLFTCWLFSAATFITTHSVLRRNYKNSPRTRPNIKRLWLPNLRGFLPSVDKWGKLKLTSSKLSRSYNLSTFLYVVFLHTSTETYCVSGCDGGSCRQNGTKDSQLDVLTFPFTLLYHCENVSGNPSLFHHKWGHLFYVWQWISLILSTLSHSHIDLFKQKKSKSITVFDVLQHIEHLKQNNTFINFLYICFHADSLFAVWNVPTWCSPLAYSQRIRLLKFSI